MPRNKRLGLHRGKPLVREDLYSTASTVLWHRPALYKTNLLGVRLVAAAAESA